MKPQSPTARPLSARTRARKFGLAPEANPKLLKKNGDYYYPLQDYRARGGGFGATNPITQSLAERRRRRRG